MSDVPRSTVTLHALEGEPLLHEKIRDMVGAAAHGMAEREGFELADVATTPDSITITLEADQLVAVGFAAELRRVTTKWYASKFGVEHLWGEPPLDDDGPSWA